MNNKMTGQQYLDFMAGQINVLKYACATLIGMRSDRSNIIKLIKGIPAYPIEETSSEHYRRGIKDIVEELDALSDVATLAEQFRKQGIGSTKH
jgi:hypothetical protein